MKKVYLLMAACFGLFCSSNMFAQDINLEDQFEWDKISRDGYTVDHENPLITDAEQFSSPFSQNDLGSADGGNLSDGVLLDGKYDTFWHSVWTGGNVDGGTHYLQVEMPDDFDEETLIAFIYARRTNADNDHTTEWCVMGTDDPEAEKDECEELAYITTPFTSKTDVCMSTPFKTGGYMYLRFYSEKEEGASYGTRGYFHIGDFNIYPVVKIEDNKAAWIELEAAYNKYQAYQDTYMDVLGENPGQYSQEAYDAFMKALDAYDELVDDDPAEKILAVRDLIVQTAEAIAPTKVPFLSKDMPAGSGYYRIRAGMEYTTGDKYMMGYRNEGKIWGIWGTPDFDELTDNIQALWKIEIKSDSTYDIVNMYHDGRFMKVARSTNVEMTTEATYADSLLTFDAAGYDSDYERAYVNIRWATQPANDFVYLHQNGHSASNHVGTGDNGYLVGWCNTYETPSCGASEWFFEEVPAEEAAQIIADFEPYKNRDVWVDEFKMMMKAAPDMIEVAKDVAQINLLTKASQFSSPYSQNDLGSADGGNLSDGVLIDGKTNTYWHSVWSAKDEYPEGKHYLQVEMPEGFDSAQQIYMRFTRRDTNNNQITNWSFKGTNEFDAEEDDCEELATFESPWNSSNQTESFKSDYFDTKGYKYIRFYNEQNNAGSAFFHLSEIQLCYDVENPQSQYIAMGEVATTLEKLVEDFSDIEPDDLDYETNFLVLQKAYDDFVALYVNPKALRDTIALAEVSVEQVVEGTDPGFWPAGTATNLTKLIADAKAYDKAGAYTPAKSDEFNAQLNAQMKAIDSAPLKIKTGKWYRLRFGTEAEYDKYGWSKTGNFPNYEIDNTDPEDPDTLGMYNAGNFGKYIAVAKRVEVPFEKADGTETTGNLIEPIAKEDIIIDKSIFGIDLEKLTDPDMALWRFVSVGDSAYAIQNKATGLYINNGGSLSVQPGLFTQHPSGYGQNAFFNKSLEGNGKSPLHLAQSQTVLCAWGNESGSGWTDADGRRGSFFVEEVADVAADYSTGGEYKMSLTPGDIYGRCYPVPVTLKTPELATLWTVAGIERTPDAADEAVEEVSVTLAKIDNAVPAGRPFIIVAAGEMPEEGDEYEPVKPEFSFTFDLVNAPQTKNYLKGAFDSKTIDVKFLAIGSGTDENALAFKNSGSTTGDNRVYITDIEEGNEGFLRKAKIVEIEFNGSLQDGIATAIQKVNRQGGIYTLDGRLIGNGNLNTISNLPKGAYILNGQKVIVK